ncbi:NAD-dependent epimerase/dehydratase family protein [Micromonospora auratinigra]|uniref:Uronate dehydrogenase n=1 Tax=Micromonospora auratinigra TaxID=261654 RepID=A0A1A8ZXE6_9ACTN|nr:NAD(P)-dependent oxidoreductase [Micromonospora auratinigra]SBT48807.1 uronate dehydrogenase [Micromonospora auratinigra]
MEHTGEPMELRDQTWVVTGAAGTIGARLVDDLAGAVGRLVATDIHPPAVPDGVESVVADLRDQEAVAALLAGAYGVVHLGGIADEADLHDLAEVNVVGTYHVLEGARRAGVRRVVYASSNRATGCYPCDVPVHPSMPPRPDGVYGAMKVAGEALCQLYADKFGLSAVAVRIGSYEERPADLRQLSTWLSPADCLRAFRAAMSAPAVGYACFYAVSANTRGWWSLEPGTALGFVPQDDAEQFAATVPDAGETMRGPQGGDFATPEYTLSRQRH